MKKKSFLDKSDYIFNKEGNADKDSSQNGGKENWIATIWNEKETLSEIVFQRII